MRVIIGRLPSPPRPGALVPPWAYVIVVQRRVINRQGRELDAAYAECARLRSRLAREREPAA